MIINFSFSNYWSFAEKTEISFLTGRQSSVTGWDEQTPAGAVTKAMILLGPNGSGKTALLKALAFLWDFMSGSFASAPDSPIAVMPFALKSDQPSSFTCLFTVGDDVWKYELVCTGERVLREALYRKDMRLRYVFVRTWNDRKRIYDIKQQGFGFPTGQIGHVRQNASLISTARQYRVPVAELICRSHPLVNIGFPASSAEKDFRARSDMLSEAASFFYGNKAMTRCLETIFQSCGTGIGKVGFREFPSGIHGDGKTCLPVFVHGSDKTFDVPVSCESSGTVGLFLLLYKLLPLLRSGGLAVADNLLSGLHPNVHETVLGLFAGSESNPGNAQIVFGGHAPAVINAFSKNQILLVEKNRNGVSDAYRLGSIQGVRNDENYYDKYLAGAYGAVPGIVG